MECSFHFDFPECIRAYKYYLELLGLDCLKPNIIFGRYIKCGAKTVVKNLGIIIVAISSTADACLIYYCSQIKHMLTVTKPVTIK